MTPSSLPILPTRTVGSKGLAVTEIGFRRYQVEVEALEGESKTDNNRQPITVDVFSADLEVLLAEFSTGVAHANADVLQLFPNPVQRTLTLQLPNGLPTGMLRISTPDGRTVLHQRATPTVDMAPLAPGLYVLSLRTAEGVEWMGRVVKE